MSIQHYHLSPQMHYVNETIDSVIDRTSLTPLMWVSNVVKDLVQMALDSFVIPHHNDIKIYEKVENQDSYRVVFEDVNLKYSMKDIIEYGSVE